MILDYTTRYPEAILLCKPTSQDKELELLFSHVGIPKDILTNQGTSFVSRLMGDLCQLLQVKELRTSVYHLQIFWWSGLIRRSKGCSDSWWTRMARTGTSFSLTFFSLPRRCLKFPQDSRPSSFSLDGALKDC